MLHFPEKKSVAYRDGLSRRDFLRVGSLSAGAVGLSLADLNPTQAGLENQKDLNCILLFLVGGPSQLDTWDLKPDAPDNVRGPFRSIATNVPGIDICEHFPLMAGMAERYAIVRSVHHPFAPVHETGCQLMQTGRLFQNVHEYPHYGSVVSHLRGRRTDAMPPFVVLPTPIGPTGINVSHAQAGGYLGSKHDPFFLNADSACTIGRFGFDVNAESEDVRARYGHNTFGQSCLLARRLIEQGVRVATVNMFDTVFNNVTWDCHADGGALATNLSDYKDTLCPMFDQAYSALLDDLHQRGLLETTLVVALGEFGRTPRLNPRGGRDHWPGCWSVLFAGAGVRGGQVIGSSDAIGAEPRDRPVTPAEIAASVYHGLGIAPNQSLIGPDNKLQPLTDGAPVHELFTG